MSRIDRRSYLEGYRAMARRLEAELRQCPDLEAARKRVVIAEEQAQRQLRTTEEAA